MTTTSMVQLLGIFIWTVLNRDGVSFQGIFSLDAHKKWTSSPGGDTFTRKDGRLETACKCTFQLLDDLNSSR